MTTRRIGAEDLAAVSALAAASKGDYNTYPIERFEEELSGRSERAPAAERAAFGSFDGATLVAVGCATPEGDGWGYISRVYVHPEYRSRGVARALVAHLEEYLASHGCHTAYLRFWGGWVNLQRYWIRRGYAREGTEGTSWAAPKGLVAGYVVQASKQLKEGAPAKRPRSAAGRR